MKCENPAVDRKQRALPLPSLKHEVEVAFLREAQQEAKFRICCMSLSGGYSELGRNCLALQMNQLSDQYARYAAVYIPFISEYS